LIESIAVLVIVSILSVAVVPAVRSLDTMAHTGLRNEVARKLALARANAMSTGKPTGLRFNAGAQSLDLLYINATADPPAALPGPTGSVDSSSSTPTASLFPGASVTDADLDDADAYDTLWYDFQGEPHFRAADGSFIATIPRDAVINCSGPNTVTVYMTTGAIQ
jgi:hypothetical protein